MDVRCYLDSAGTALPAKEMMVSICEELLSCRLGNPHSVGSAMGNSSMTKVDIARKLVLDHFGLNEYEYDVVFTSGATSSMNIIGQSLCWGESGHVLYPMNSHTSLLGLRDYAPNSSCFSSSALHCGTNDIHCGSAVQSGDVKAVASSAAGVNLLLVPGECNFSGVKADLLKAGQLSIMNQQKLLAHTKAKAVKRGISSENDGCWLWLLDAAKLASSANLDLSTLPTELRPHFVTISFYKIFGYPTGLGALLIRRDSACFLNKR